VGAKLHGVTAPCPKCKGGCDLCGGTGRVPEGAARVYLREEARRTALLPARQLDELREVPASDRPTVPEFLRKANRLRAVARWLLIITLGLTVGMVLGVLAYLVTK
jgi:hypothetical protein